MILREVPQLIWTMAHCQELHFFAVEQTRTKRSAIEPYFANMESNTSLFVALDASTHNQQILNLSFCQKELWAVGVAHGDLTSMQLLLQ